MDVHLLIEIIGYIGSGIVLVSFLMTSVFKLRIVNTIGSSIFFVYAMIIKSYPTAVMNLVLVIINLRFLWKMRQSSKSYEFVEISPKDDYLLYMLTKHKPDIDKCFPGIEIDTDKANKACFIVCEGAPVGIAMGTKDGTVFDLMLDYSVPAYRDFSVGKFLSDQLILEGITELRYAGPDQNHIAYLNNLNFQKDENGVWVKKL